jgi:hypothetical protein
MVQSPVGRERAAPARECLDDELDAVESDRGHGMSLARGEAEVDRLAAALG